ncbi:hypothetical protein ARMGADRAFT_1006287 [Armillaria gallica]|uniref:Uncharacterized protein n=1 Tax=Armillaria gallica TaxID=47427 RepID=A0A2H3EWL8_ARMGA|nr:hypothetical protein ARMGADRAFT_1006287 [Armillaria gallica]
MMMLNRSFLVMCPYLLTWSFSGNVQLRSLPNVTLSDTSDALWVTSAIGACTTTMYHDEQL